MIFEIKFDFYGDKIFGILIKEDSNYFTIKLKSGYNISLRKDEIKILEKKEIVESKKENSKKPDKNNGSKILLIHTGGTIASKIDYETGAVSNEFSIEELLNLYPEFTNEFNITPIMLKNISSEDVDFKFWNLLLKTIEKNIDGYDGVIIGHGTDTIHYTASILNYFIRNLSIPILLVGAQRSSDRASSDAFSNLKAAFDFIRYNKSQVKKFRRVGVVMHKTLDDNSFALFDSINLKKMHSSKRDAFKQINYKNALDINYDFENNLSQFEMKRDELFTNENKNLIKFYYIDENCKIGFFKSHPNILDFEIENLKIFDVIIIEGTGFGHMPSYTLNKLKEVSKKTKLIISTQTTFGEVNLDVYSNGKNLKEIVFGDKLDLTSETLFSKSLFCYSNKEKTFEENFFENNEFY